MDRLEAVELMYAVVAECNKVEQVLSLAGERVCLVEADNLAPALVAGMTEPIPRTNPEVRHLDCPRWYSTWSSGLV